MWTAKSKKTLVIAIAFIFSAIPHISEAANLKIPSAPQISKSSDYLPLDQCKLADSENPASPANAYRSKDLNFDLSRPVRVLIYRIDFSDLTSQQSSNKTYINLEQNIDNYFYSVSRGKLTFTWTLSEKVNRLSKPVTSYGANLRSNLNSAAAIITDAEKSAFQEFKVSDFDYVIVAPPESTTSKEISTSFAYFKESSDFLNATILGGDFWQSSQPWELPAHEIGHSLGLLDLYSYQAADGKDSQSADYTSQYKYMSYFDLMNWPTGPAPELTAWNRWMLGFLQDSEVRCLPSLQTISFIAPIESQNDLLKALFIKISDSEMIVIENRQPLGFDFALPPAATGALVYKVTLSAKTGEGPFRVLNKSLNVTKVKTSTAIQGTDILLVDGYQIQTLLVSKNNAIVKVTRHTN